MNHRNLDIGLPTVKHTVSRHLLLQANYYCSWNCLMTLGIVFIETQNLIQSRDASLKWMGTGLDRESRLATDHSEIRLYPYYQYQTRLGFLTTASGHSPGYRQDILNACKSRRAILISFFELWTYMAFIRDGVDQHNPREIPSRLRVCLGPVFMVSGAAVK
jgi:hypothetical protein